MNLTKIFLIARWEFLTRIRNFAFLFSLVLTPLAVAGLSHLPKFFSESQSETKIQHFLLIEKNCSLFTQLQEKIYFHYKLPDGNPAYIFYPEQTGSVYEEIIATETERIASGQVRGIIFIERKNNFYHMNFLFDSEVNQLASERIRKEIEILTKENFIAENFSSGPQLSFSEQKITLHKADDRKIIFSVVMIGIYVLVVAQSAQIFIRGIYEEKANRLIELLLSSVSTKNLFYGKLFGITSLGILQILFWSLCGIFLGGIRVGLTEFAIFFPAVIVGYLIYAVWLLAIGTLVKTEYSSQLISGYAAMMAMLPVLFIADADANKIFLSFGKIIPFFSTPVLLAEKGADMIGQKEFFLTILQNILFLVISIIFCSKIFSRYANEERFSLRKKLFPISQE